MSFTDDFVTIQRCENCNRDFAEDFHENLNLIDTSDAIYAVTHTLKNAEKNRQNQLKQEKIDEIMSRVEMALEHSNMKLEDNEIKTGNLLSIEKEKSKLEERQTLSEIFGFLENSSQSRNVIINELQNWFTSFQDELSQLSEKAYSEDEMGEENFKVINKALRCSILMMNRLRKLIQNGVLRKGNGCAEKGICKSESNDDLNSSDSSEHVTIDAIKIPKKIFNEKELSSSKNLEQALKTINTVLDNAILTSKNQTKNNFIICSKQFNFVSNHFDQKKKLNDELLEKLKQASVQAVPIVTPPHEQTKNESRIVKEQQKEIDELKDKVGKLEGQLKKKFSSRKSTLSENSIKETQNFAQEQSLAEETSLKRRVSDKLFSEQLIKNSMTHGTSFAQEFPSAPSHTLFIPSNAHSENVVKDGFVNENANRFKSNEVKIAAETKEKVKEKENVNNEEDPTMKNQNEVKLPKKIKKPSFAPFSSQNKKYVTHPKKKTEKLTEQQNTNVDLERKRINEKNQGLRSEIQKRKKDAIKHRFIANVDQRNDYDKILMTELHNRHLLNAKLQFEKELQKMRNFIVNEQYRFQAVLRKIHLDHDAKISKVKNENTRTIQALLHFQHVINRFIDCNDEGNNLSNSDIENFFNFEEIVADESKKSLSAIEILVELERKIYKMILEKTLSVRYANSDKLQFAKDLQRQRRCLQQITEACSVQKNFAKEIEIQNQMLSKEYKKVLNELECLENNSNALNLAQHTEHSSFYQITNNLINQKENIKSTTSHEILRQSSKELKKN